MNIFKNININKNKPKPKPNVANSNDIKQSNEYTNTIK